MSIKDITAIAIELDVDRPALRAAALLCAQFSAHATALVLGIHVGSDYAEPSASISDILADIALGQRGAAAREHERIAAWLGKHHRHFETRNVVIEDALLRQEVLAHARRTDLICVTQPHAAPHEEARLQVFESVLFGAGRPVLLAPSGWSGDKLTDRILIGWNASREAARAVADALPLLRTAHDVVIATVDAKPSRSGHGPSPGKDVAVYLERHGVNCRVHNLDGMNRGVSGALLDEAAAVDANLIVMGGYGHARAQEWLWGGATRDISQRAETPLLLSH